MNKAAIMCRLAHVIDVKLLSNKLEGDRVALQDVLSNNVINFTSIPYKVATALFKMHCLCMIRDPHVTTV